MVMQVLVLAVQNAVPYQVMGVATSGSTLFRQVGGSIGVAAFGAIFANRLASNLANAFPSVGLLHPSNRLTPDKIAQLPPEVHDLYVKALTDSLDTVFIVAACVGVAAFALTWFLREVPLKTTAQAPDIGDGFHASHDDDRLREIERALSLLASRQNRWELYERGAVRAGLELEPPELWLLARLGERVPISEDTLAAELHTEIDGPLDELRERGYAYAPGGEIVLTERGQNAYERLVEVRCAGLRELLDGWEPDEHPELKALIDRLGRDLVAEIPTPAAAAA